jgi:hypothetical protein
MLCRLCGTPLSDSTLFCPTCGATLSESDAISSSKGLPELRRRLGRKPQLAGGVTMLMGVGVLVSVGPQTGNPVNLHKLAYAFILIGVFLLAAGTLARWYYLPWK